MTTGWRVAVRCPRPTRGPARGPPRAAGGAWISASVRARIRGGCLGRKVAYANALRRACPRGAVRVAPFPIIQDGMAGMDEACRLEQTRTQKTSRRGLRIQGVENLRPW